MRGIVTSRGAINSGKSVSRKRHRERRLGHPGLLITFSDRAPKLTARFAPLPPSSHTGSAVLGLWTTLKLVTNRGDGESARIASQADSYPGYPFPLFDQATEKRDRLTQRKNHQISLI